jgi:hypothetical protein
MSWLMLAMIAFPEKQKKCQDELDAVVGRSRLPTFKDRENLPYLQATIRELLRWRPVAPLGKFPSFQKNQPNPNPPVLYHIGIPHCTKEVTFNCTTGYLLVS